jgi:hypothetical protein
VAEDGREYAGVSRGIDSDGALLVWKDGAALERVVTGSVRLTA